VFAVRNFKSILAVGSFEVILQN